MRPHRAIRRLLTCVASLLLLAACGESGTGTEQVAAAGGGQDGSLLGLAQAQQAAQQWWNDHEQALLHRDAKAIARVDAEPLALVEVELVRAALATGQGIVPAGRQPSAVRVHVPAQQSWPIPVLAVYDIPAQGGATQHLAVLLAKLNPGAQLVATESATLDAPEPALDTDGAGFVRMGAQAGSLATAYAQSMQAAVHGGPTPAQAPFAPGKLTSEAAATDAALLHDPAGRSHGTLSSVDLDYAAIAVPAPVFQLAGGAGGFTLVASRRVETLHPMQGQALLQDAQRRNYGVDLAPGQYQQITLQSALFLAARIPPGGAPAEVAGSGGGVYQEG